MGTSCTSNGLQRGELITRDEGRCFAPWVDALYLRDWFQAHSPDPGVRTPQRADLFSDQLGYYQGRKNWEAGVSVSWASIPI